MVKRVVATLAALPHVAMATALGWQGGQGADVATPGAPGLRAFLQGRQVCAGGGGRGELGWGWGGLHSLMRWKGGVCGVGGRGGVC